MEKTIIIIRFDIAKEGRKVSREQFKGVQLGSRRHKDVTKYSRKSKHKKDLRSE